MVTRVYVDGFNLYYGALKGTRYKWLNLDMLCRNLLSGHQIDLIRYFTAPVSGVLDPQGPVRQHTYLRALRTVPHITVHMGSFQTKNVWMALTSPPPSGPRKVQVIKTEEKGSDVNLASYLLFDGMQRKCDTVVILSNDSDLVEPLRLARYELGLKVGVINPHPPHKKSRRLTQDAHFVRQVRSGALSVSQFPRSLIDTTGRFQKPAGW